MDRNLKRILKIRKDRDWKQFHSPKNIAISLSLEASEVLELFQWSPDNKLPENMRAKVKGELADVYYWLLLLSNDLHIDLNKALSNKLIEIETKYPIEKSKGNSVKYTELR